jgi:hypothetical protein
VIELAVVGQEWGDVGGIGEDLVRGEDFAQDLAVI